jgi:aspartate racemase
LKEKVIGILGGMGPEATTELFYRIVKETSAKKDQDHLRIIIDNNPKIPDRTEAIMNRGPSPFAEMAKTARTLEKAGADFIIMPCNAAHFYCEDLKKITHIPILNMIELTTNTIGKNYPKTKNVGIIATDGTIKTKIYDEGLGKIGVKVTYPPSDLQNAVMEAIYCKIKAGRVEDGRAIITKVARHLAQCSDLVISGCTEVSLALKNVCLSVPIIDPLQILAEVAVATALGKYNE